MKLRVTKYSVSFFIVILYLVMGSFVVWKYSIGQKEPDLKLSLFGFAIIAYGLFRGYRAYKDYQSQQEEQDESN